MIRKPTVTKKMQSSLLHDSDKEQQYHYFFRNQFQNYNKHKQKLEINLGILKISVHLDNSQKQNKLEIITNLQEINTSKRGKAVS